MITSGHRRRILTITSLAITLYAGFLSGAELVKEQKGIGHAGTPQRAAVENRVRDAVDFVVVSILSQLSASRFRGREPVARLKELSRSFGTMVCDLSGKLVFSMGENGVAMSTDKQWVPLSCQVSGGSTTLPELELCCGGLGLETVGAKHVDTFVVEGTRVRVDGEIFTFRQGWKREGE